MAEYIMVVVNDSKTVIAKKMPGQKARYRTFASVPSQSNAQWMVDALNEKHAFEYVTGKDEEKTDVVKNA